MIVFEDIPIGSLIDIGANPNYPKLKLDNITCVDLVDREKIVSKRFNKFYIRIVTVEEACKNLNISKEELKEIIVNELDREIHNN